MTGNRDKAEELRAIMAREERKFLMECYGSRLVALLESRDAAGPGERDIEALLVVQRYASVELQGRISAVLAAHGVETATMTADADIGTQAPSEEDGLFAHEGEEEDDFELEDDEGDVPDAEEIDDADVGLFSEADEAPTALTDIDEEEQTQELFAADEELAEAAPESTAPGPSPDAADEGDPSEELFGADTEEDEGAGVLFADDIYAGHGTSAPVRPDEEPEEQQLEDAAELDGSASPGGDARAQKPSREELAGETPGFAPTEGHENQDTPGFTPTEGHENQDTPGFTPTEGHENQDTPGFTPTKGHENQDTPGFTPTKGHENQDTPGFTPTKGGVPRKRDKRSDPTGPEDKPGEEQTKRRRPQRREITAEERKAGRAKQGRSAAAGSDARQAARLRAAKAKEELERRKKLREAERSSREQGVEEADDQLDELLAQLTYSVSVDDLEQYLDLKIAPDDRMKLERRLQQKMREASLKSMLTQLGQSDLSFAMIPRVPRFFRSGTETRVTVANLVRSFPQLFESVQQVILKYRAEPFFQRETPKLDWAFVSVEALPGSMNRSFSQQRQVLKQYAYQFQANELRINRRTLVDALWDVIVVQMVTKEGLLRRTVDLSNSKVGRQNLAIINCGDAGIRINDIARAEAHEKLGVCPSW